MRPHCSRCRVRKIGVEHGYSAFPASNEVEINLMHVTYLRYVYWVKKRTGGSTVPLFSCASCSDFGAHYPRCARWPQKRGTQDKQLGIAAPDKAVIVNIANTYILLIGFF